MTGTVIVVDNDDNIRKALTRLLQVKGFLTRSLPSAEECLAAIGKIHGPICVIADQILPGINGHELQRQLPHHVPFIMLTGCADVKQTVATMLAGAVDLLEKPVQEDRLSNAVARALVLAAYRINERETMAALDAKVRRLTPREREVMEMVTTGLRNKQVANLLGIVEKTVKVYRANVMNKLEVDSLAELVRCADKLQMKYTAPAKGPSMGAREGMEPPLLPPAFPLENATKIDHHRDETYPSLVIG